FAARLGAVHKRLGPKIAALRKQYADNDNAFWSAAFDLWRENAPRPPAIDILVDHIDHVVKLVGIEHVGLGSDFDGAGSFPVGLEDVSGFPRITMALLKRGYNEREIRLILGENFMRVFAQVEETSARLKKKS
ncbi:MAG: membrane dipeptidase, partial [Candidatus Aminicenantes bacterium]|nr:membrane dipeptidase [Candidatus Aminicenantes bacterium]